MKPTTKKLNKDSLKKLVKEAIEEGQGGTNNPYEIPEPPTEVGGHPAPRPARRAPGSLNQFKALKLRKWEAALDDMEKEFMILFLPNLGFLAQESADEAVPAAFEHLKRVLRKYSPK